jgi:hypothetical protein
MLSAQKIRTTVVRTRVPFPPCPQVQQGTKEEQTGISCVYCRVISVLCIQRPGAGSQLAEEDQLQGAAAPLAGHLL